MRVYLQTVETEADKKPRFYQLVLSRDLIGGWMLVREWGSQGSAGRIKKDHFETRDDAQSALLKIRDAQIRRGFRVVYMRGEENQ